MQDQRNFVIGMILMVLLYVAMVQFGPKPAPTPQQDETPVEVPETVEVIDRETAVVTGQRIPIDTPLITGSMTLDGARIDDISLKDFRANVDEDSGNFVLMSPENTEGAYFMFDGWTSDKEGDLDSNLPWQLVSGESLTPDSPVTIAYDGGNFTVTRTISVDDAYLFTFEDTITNTTAGELGLVRVGASRRYGKPVDASKLFMIVEGPASVVGSKEDHRNYKKLEGSDKNLSPDGEGIGGWVGLSDKLWLGAAIPPQNITFEAKYNKGTRPNGTYFEARYITDQIELNAGESFTSTGYAFAGAKTHSILTEYEDTPGIQKLDSAIHWGSLLGILVKPFSLILEWLNAKTGNFGIAILLFTLLVKIVLFPLNNKAYGMQAKMKSVQPKMKRLQNLYGDDRMKLQQEMMALYKKEGVNPMSGCLPIIPQMFIFLALYKALLIIPEMRHAHFLWISDLSDRDPTSILNLFGILPWDPIPFGFMAPIALGVLALAYGVSMAMVQTLSATPGDAMQAKIFRFMPWVFMFILAPFAAGLLLYWVWSTILTFAQQYYITRRHKVETPLDRFIKRLMGKSDSEESA